MTTFSSNASPPSWCELRGFQIVALRERETLLVRRRSPQERVIVSIGPCQIGAGSMSQVLDQGQFLDLPPDAGDWRIAAGGAACEAIVVSGNWGKELGGCGLFSVRDGAPARVAGDPVAYTKTTGFDSHYHDCDEYWFILEGTGTVVVGDRHTAVAGGDCVAIGMGHHHDFPLANGVVRAAYFETTLEGRKRIGHLWDHTHGTAQPMPERI